MTKKTFSKVVAAVMVACMCFTAVFTGAVSATETVSCSVTGYSYNKLAENEYVTYEVTFSSETAFTAGVFTVDCPEGLTFVSCAYAQREGGNIPQVHVNVTGKKVLFAGFKVDSESFDQFTSLTFLLKFVPSTRNAGDSWTVSVSDVSITNSSEASYNSPTASGKSHIHNFNGTSSTVSGVTTTACSVDGCTEVKTEVSSDSTAGPNDLATGEKSANIKFAKDGDVIFQALLPKEIYENAGGTVYFVYSYDDGVNAEKATDSVTGELTTIGGEQYYAFPCLKNAGIGRMGRDIKGNFVVVNGDTVTKSNEWTYSIKQCLENLIETGDELTKNYAKALWNYGYYTTKRLYETKGTFKAELDTWDPFVAETPTSSYELPTKTSVTVNPKGDKSWAVSNIKATTGYKPSMTVTLNNTVESVAVKIYKSGDLVYSKELTINSNTFTISDFPTKYLTGDIVISTSASEKTGTYGFGRYAYFRSGSDEGNVFYWMMQYSYHLGQAFPG